MPRKPKINTSPALSYLIKSKAAGLSADAIRKGLAAQFDIEVAQKTVDNTYESIISTFDTIITGDEQLAAHYKTAALDAMAELEQIVRQQITLRKDLTDRLEAAKETMDPRDYGKSLMNLNFSDDRLHKFLETLLRVNNQLVNTTIVLDKSRSVEMLYEMLAYWLDQKKVKILDQGIKMKVEAKRKKRKVEVEV